MVKGTTNIRSFFQPKVPSAKASHSTSPSRPPLSAYSASARNNLCAGNSSHAPSPSKPLAKHDGRSPQTKIPGVLPGDTCVLSSENGGSNIRSSSSNPSSPETFSTPRGTTPLKRTSRRSSGVRRLPFSSTDLENVKGQNSPGASEECVTRTASNSSSRAASSDDVTTTTDDSDPSSTSGSDVENVSLPRPASARRQSSACLSRQSSARQEGLRRMSLGPKIEAAVSKLEKTPTKPSRAGRSSTPCASPGSLRACVPKSPVLPDHHQSRALFDLQENSTCRDDHNVQVIIRTRPTSVTEAAKPGFNKCLRQDGPTAITWLGQPETRFTFDHVAGENISQEQLFNVVGIPIVENCTAGYNSCMFAYGQTGSGKTHTMLGDISSHVDRPSDNRGMTPRIFEYLFSRIRKEEQGRQLEHLRYVCKCSFLEIYNEQIADLLEPSSSNLQMREDSKKGVYVENLTEVVVGNVEDVFILLLKGAANRKVASTNMNRESSRSHSVFTCVIESKWETNSTSNVRFGRLSLVDLAGSERQKSSLAEGVRLKEAASINKSLSTLGLVIMTLVDIANGKPRHVPYRDSKLTFLLQDSLGGNSKTVIIATISPSSCCSMETLSTLKFAQRAKFIQNNAVVNEDASGDVLALRREIQQLKEEVSRLRCQSISSMQRECRRASNEFFRMSLTGRDLFDAAEKERADEGVDLKSAELLGKVKALEAVLAGALRREQAAEYVVKQQSDEIQKANQSIGDQELELRNCKSLLKLHADDSTCQQSPEITSSSDSEPHVLLAEQLELAKSLEFSSTVSKLEAENIRLTEQLHRYRTFFESGERETMAGEIQGLRDQVLELLDGKITVERGILSTTIAQGDNYRKELETCRNDLTNCLEASSQLQRQVSELQGLVNQLNEQIAHKESNLKEIKNSVENYANIVKGKDEEMKSLRLGWETATAKLYRDLLEGERALVDAGQEMGEILGEDWLQKNPADVPARWSLESAKSLREVDIEHDYFKGRDSCNSDDIFGDRKSSRMKRSFGISPRLSTITEEKLKLEANVARLEEELRVYRERVLEEEHVKEELHRVQRENLRLLEEMGALANTPVSTSEASEENVDLKVEVQQLRVKLHEQCDELEISRSQIAALDRHLADLEKMKLYQAGALAMKSQEISDLLERNLEVQEESSRVCLELKDTKEKAEDLKAALDELAQANDELKAESAVLELQAEKDAVKQTNLTMKISDLESDLKSQQEELSELETEIERLEVLLHEAQCRQQELENTVKDDKEFIFVLHGENKKLEGAVEMISQKMASTDTVQEELRVTVSSLHVELEKKTRRIEESDAQALRMADSHAHERILSAADLERCRVRIGELEASLAEKSGSLGILAEALCSATAAGDALKMERDAARANSAMAQAEATSRTTHIQELREKLDMQSVELEILSELMQSVTTEMNEIGLENFKRTSRILTQELEHERASFAALQHQLLSLTAILEQNQADLLESRAKEDDLLADLLHMKDQLSRSERSLESKRESETGLQGELSALSEIVKSTELENDFLREELAANQALVLEHESSLANNEENIEANAQKITLLKETVEQLQTQLERTEDVLHGLEYDLSLHQERAAEDSVFKQELLNAQSIIHDLQAKHENGMEDQLALEAASMDLMEGRLLETERRVTDLTTENHALNSIISNLQTTTSALEAVVAEKNEAMSSLEKEMTAARVTLTRMTMECSIKSEACRSLDGDVGKVAAERDHLNSQLSILGQKLDDYQRDAALHVAAVEVLHGELLVSMISTCCYEGLMLDVEAKVGNLEEQKSAQCADFDHHIEKVKQLESELARKSETADQVYQEMARLKSYIAELQAEKTTLTSQLAQRSESENSLLVQICSISEAADKSRAETDQLRSQIEDFQIRNDRLERDLALKIDEVSSLGAEVLAARYLTAQSLEQIDEMRARITALEEKHRDMERDIALKNRAISSSAAQLSEAQATTFSMTRDLDDLNQRIAALVSERDSLEEVVLRKDDLLSSMGAELNAMEGSIPSLQLLRTKLADLQLTKVNDEEELQLARKHSITLQDEIQSLSVRLADSEESNNHLKLELAENITAMSSMQDRISIASRSFNYNHEEMKAMKAEIGTLVKEKDSLQAEVDHKVATISFLENELVGARASAASSRSCLGALETQIVSLQAERDIIEKQITEVEVDVISSLQTELTEAQDSLKFLDNEMAEVRRVAGYISDENSTLQARIVALEAEKHDFEEVILSTTKLITSLEADLAAERSSSMALSEELKSLEAQVLELLSAKTALECEVSGSLRNNSDLSSTVTITSSMVQENDEMRLQIKSWEEKCCVLEEQLTDAFQEMDRTKAQITQQELQLSSLEELLAQKAEALQHMASKAVCAAQECDNMRSEIEGLKDALRLKDSALNEQEKSLTRLEMCVQSTEGNESDELRALMDERDQALEEVQALHGELRAAQALVASHKSSVHEAQKFAEVNILRASGKDEEARTLKASVLALKTQNSELEKQMEATKSEAEKLRKARDEVEMELQGMKNRMTMLQAVHSTGSRNFKGFQAAQAASLDLQKTLEDKEAEVSQMFKRMSVLHSHNESQASRLEELESELAHVHQELDDLQSQCEDKDAQVRALNGQLKEAEALTQDVMRDLHNVKLDISNYASLVSQQQLELISERARHSDDAREKDEELSSLQTQLNQERQNWMIEMNHKQAEIVVARVLSEKMRLKNKTLAAEYKRLKADYNGKKKKLKTLEQQLTQLTTDTRRFSIEMESEADFDEVKQFQALLAQATDHERAQKK